MLKKNKKIDKDDGTLKNEDSALHLACLGLQKKSMEKLLLSRVNVNGQNVLQDTPLHILIKLYEENEDAKRPLIADMIELLSGFCEGSL